MVECREIIEPTGKFAELKGSAESAQPFVSFARVWYTNRGLDSINWSRDRSGATQRETLIAGEVPGRVRPTRGRKAAPSGVSRFPSDSDRPIECRCGRGGCVFGPVLEAEIDVEVESVGAHESAGGSRSS